MKTHPYLRAYMAGIAIPTMFLLVGLSAFCIARFVYHVPLPIERLIVFPMAVIPNAFGVWNMLYVSLRARYPHPIGLHGVLLPFLLAPLGITLAKALGFLAVTSKGFVYFQAITITYGHFAIFFPVVLVVYYLVWKHLVGFFNELLGVGG